MVQRFLSEGGRIFRVREDKRTITIAFKQDESRVFYGAAIHRQTDKSDTFIRKPHNYTAVYRCVNKPIIISIDPDLTANKIERQICLAMYKLGVYKGGPADIRRKKAVAEDFDGDFLVSAENFGA